MREAEKESLVSKAVGLGVALAAAWLAQKALASLWKATVGHDLPKPENPGDARFGEVATAAALTGAVAYLSRVLATRGTAKFLR